MEHQQGISENTIQIVDQLFPTDYWQESHILNLLPEGVYVCDMAGVIRRYNEQAAQLWGRRPVLGDARERFNGAWKIYHPDGTPLPHDQAPAALCLKDGVSRKDMEYIIERPDLSRIFVRVNVMPIKDNKGMQVGVINCFYDITEKKETEKELQHKTAELQDYVDNASIALHWVDANGIIKWANQAELDMLGYKKEEYIGHHIGEFHVHHRKIEDILTRLSSNETLHCYESELRCKDGTIKTVQISSNVFWEDEKFVHTRCFSIDVTEQKKLIQALKESESLYKNSELRYKQLIQTLQAPLYTTDAEGRITLFNKAAADLWGREPEIGKDLWCGSFKILNTDGSNMPLDQCPMAVCLKEQRPVYGEEILVIRPDGSIRYVAPHPQPVFDESGKMTGAVNMLIDITESKQAAKALGESEARYRDLVGSLEKEVENKVRELKRSEERYHKMVEEVEDYAILLLDKEGIIQNWNKGAEKIKGYKEEEIVGKSFQEFYLPKDREAGLPLQLLARARETGKAIHEGWRKRKDGSAFWGSIVLTALHDNQNNVIGFSKVTRDLTERKLSEDRMKEYLSQLEFQNKELEQFVYAASHDMKEPLRKIHFYSDYIAGDVENRLSPKSQDFLNRSINAAGRMKKLIEDLLTYSRSTSGTESYEAVDLNEVVNEIVLMHKEEPDRKSAKIKVAKLPVIQAVPFQMKQLFFNLINNAVKYKHPDRNLQIDITYGLARGSEIEDYYSAEANMHYHKISVIDNGSGFDSRYALKIFEIFQRLNNTSNARGTGIGLAICKKIVQNHKGVILAAGKFNEGASFTIYLPAA